MSFLFLLPDFLCVFVRLLCVLGGVYSATFRIIVAVRGKEKRKIAGPSGM